MTVSDLYCMAMESSTAYQHMERLCALLGVAFPPEQDDTTEVTELMPFIASIEQSTQLEH